MSISTNGQLKNGVYKTLINNDLYEKIGYQINKCINPCTINPCI